MYIGLHVKYPLFLSDCNESCNLLTDFLKLLKFNVNPSVRTDMTKIIVAFRNFAKAPKN